MSRALAAFLAIASAGFFASASASAAESIWCPQLLDVDRGEMLKGRLIRMQAGLITSVEAAGEDAPADIRLPEGHTCLPGLTDLHVHMAWEFDENHFSERYTLNPGDYAFRMVGRAERTLQAGFTTVRDLGDAFDLTVALREAIAKGEIVGPRIFTATTRLSTTGGHADPTAGWRHDMLGNPGPQDGVFNGVGEARKAVRERYKRGANLIKITATGGVLSTTANAAGAQMGEDEIRAVVQSAADYGMHVAAHAHGAEGIKRAVRAGVRTIEHGSYLDDEAIRLMRERKTWLVPTIMAGKWVTQRAEIPGFLPEMVRPKARTVGPQVENAFTRAYRGGVRIAFGTDSGVSEHGDNAWEFIYMVAAGMPPLEAIRSATIYAAEVLDRSATMGQLEAGRVADIIAVDGHPVEDISAMRRVALVIKDGTVYKVPAVPANEDSTDEPQSDLAQPALQQEPADAGDSAD